MTEIIPLDVAERREEHAREPQRKARPLDAVEAVQFHGRPIPDRRWLVDGWIPDRAVTLLGGDGGTGKSLIALQLMIAASLGRPWLGMPVPRRRSLALFCEDDPDEVHIRASAVAGHYDATLGDLEGCFWSPRSGRENVLMSFGDRDLTGKPTALWSQVETFVRNNGVQLLIVDTLADTFSGNENFRAQARAFVNLLRGLAAEMDGAVVLTAHPSVAGQASGSGLSGSTAWNNSVRSRLYLTRPTGEDADPNDRLLKRLKSNYGAIGDEIKLRWTGGVMVAKTAATGIDRIAETMRVDRLFVEGLRLYAERGIELSHKPSSTYAPNHLAKLPSCAGIAAKAFERSMHRLLSEGRIRSEEFGPPSRRRNKLVVVS